MSQMPTPQWVYRARLVRVTDGDTIVVLRDMGDRVYQETEVRIRGLDTPEKRGATKAAGLVAMAFTADWLKAVNALDPWPLTIETHVNQREKYGRLLATVWRTVDGRELNQDLLDAGLAVPFMVGRD